MKNAIVFILILFVVAAIFLYNQGHRCSIDCDYQEDFGVSPGFDPSTRSSIAGVGPLPPQARASRRPGAKKVGFADEVEDDEVDDDDERLCGACQ